MSAQNRQMTDEELAQFDWITLQKDMDRAAPTETRSQKLMRKIGENPFVPIGCGATTLALGFGLYSFKAGKRKLSQYMMRTRIAAQGFTVLALLIGIGMGASKVGDNSKT